MDTSKEYILMCERAVEVQELWIDMDDLRKTFGWCYCDDQGNNHLQLDNQGFKQDRTNKLANTTWLPRQDQLQGMVEDKYTFDSLIWTFHDFISDEKGTHMRIKTTTVSMEQLWLAFVMFEKFNKTWNGKEWIVTFKEK